MGIHPSDPGVVTGYQVDGFTCTWSEDQLFSHLHIYPGITGKVSLFTNFSLESWCDYFSFLDQAVAKFEQGLDPILTDSVDTRIGHILG